MHVVLMESGSISRIFRSSKLGRDAIGAEVFRPGRPLRIVRDLNAESLEGRHEGRARTGSGESNRAMALSKKLAQRLGKSRALADRAWSRGAARFRFDARQRAVVKVHYFSHGGGGGAALRAHARYAARDAVSRDASASPTLANEPASGDDRVRQAEVRAKSHARYLAGRRGERSVFYDAAESGLDGAARVARWAERDRRHFRIILAPENGSRLGDLASYAREVMRRAEAALGTKLEWVAVDHWDTDNPHTHIILRGRRRDASNLVIPREFVKHGFRSLARDVATERLGERTREDERLALVREARAHRPTRLDPLIDAQLDKRYEVRIARLQGRSPDMTDALKARAHELKRLGLAIEVRRNVLRFEPGWRDALTAMELHLDVRKALVRSRTQLLTKEPQARRTSGLLRGRER